MNQHFYLALLLTLVYIRYYKTVLKTLHWSVFIFWILQHSHTHTKTQAIYFVYIFPWPTCLLIEGHGNKLLITVVCAVLFYVYFLLKTVVCPTTIDVNPWIRSTYPQGTVFYLLYIFSVLDEGCPVSVSFTFLPGIC